jgi:hypothetical protein
MKSHSPSETYLEKAKLLSSEDAERLMARMRGRFRRRTEDKKLSEVEALALQLEYEDEELAEWRQRMTEIREHAKKK